MYIICTFAAKFLKRLFYYYCCSARIEKIFAVLTDPLPVVKREAHEPDFTISVVELVDERHATVRQFDVIVKVDESPRLPADDTVLARL